MLEYEIKVEVCVDAGVHEYHDDESVCQRPKKDQKYNKFGFFYLEDLMWLRNYIWSGRTP